MLAFKDNTFARGIEKISLFSILLSFFFLPIDLNLNNIFLVIFIVLQVVLLFIENSTNKVHKLSKNWKQLVLYTLPFWLTALGLLYTDNLSKGFDFLVRVLPLFFLPIIAVINPKIFFSNFRKIGYILVAGCILVAFWSWYNSIQFILESDQSMYRLFGPLHTHHNLVKHLDVHPAYLSIFIFSAVGFMSIEICKVSRGRKIILSFCSVILTAFMFHLLSRTAMLYFLVSALIYLVYQKQWKIIVSGFIAVFVLGFMAYNMNNNYLRDRLFKSLNLFEKETQFSRKDDRFDRLSASYEIFKKRPLIGYGTAGEDKYRRAVFKRNKDLVAYNKNYNSHNQFFEYLSTYGILGATVFVLFFGHLFFRVLKSKNYYLLFMLTGLFLGCVTESILERSTGVVYTALLIAFIISFQEHVNKEISI